MKIKKPVLIVLGEPNSTFIEILSKVLNKISLKKKINFPIILIGSKNLINSQLKYLKRKINFIEINKNKTNIQKLKKKIYLINIKYEFNKPFENISMKSRSYISKCFAKALGILNVDESNIIINGPISKKDFLNFKFPGITEYIFNKSKKKLSKEPTMVIFNKKFSVTPITTHVPLKNVNKIITEKKIINSVLLIDKFYKNYLKYKPNIAILGLNPHCETSLKHNEEDKIIRPAIKKLINKNINVNGPFSADTFFIKENISKYNSVIGMYHDQVLTPFKTIYGFDASNITLGLPFLRLSVDHGPNEKMLGKNKSNTNSLENIFNFINSIK